MSHDTLNDQGTGYYLPEDSQLRLKQLHSHIDFLSRLARPRTYDEVSEVSPEVGMDELATCLELFTDQAELVLNDLTWGADFPRMAGEADEDDEADAAATSTVYASADASTVAEPELGFKGQVAAVDAAGHWVDPGGDRLVFGMSVDQADALGELIQTIAAHGDVIASSEDNALADATLPTLGQAIMGGADALRALMDTVENQMIVPPTKRGSVREPRAAYGVGSTSDEDSAAIPGWPLSAHPTQATHASARPRPH
ncbi:hypothetical protein MNO14_03010 [Luteimonas sp. S4-F44]|uniref:XAC0095 family protein n=1 Tax=Luteimonas sp. S4-F44 TaxID=2925842 RepID=UPI001F532BB1|nr:hypothetical protein [Luteimonas sp. S4-F44]UNK43086.1 hypothetical protein MNO14_03010 [Luteimonas sp. S4-F44]